MIIYGFSNRPEWGSQLISETTKRADLGQKKEATPSHFFIMMGHFVFHSNFANGCHIEPYSSFKKKNNVMAMFRKVRCHKSEAECWLTFNYYVNKAWGKGYDFMAIAYFSWRIILKFLFGAKMPDRNKWESPNKWFCNEIYEIELKKDVSMKSPNDLYWEFVSNPGFDQVEIRQ